MIVATAEYRTVKSDFTGVQNILAGFGTCFIDVSEWDKPQEDENEGLHQLTLFSFQVELAVHIMNFLYDAQLTEA